MSKYYQINGLKVRVSDHEPNTSLRGSSDIYLYVKSVCNELLSIENQIEAICEKEGYNLSDFQPIIEDWKDGTYNIHVFEKECIESIENYIDSSLLELIASHNKSNDEKLKGYSLSQFANHVEIKALSEKTGVSQSYIKKHFNIII